MRLPRRAATFSQSAQQKLAKPPMQMDLNSVVEMEGGQTVNKGQLTQLESVIRHSIETTMLKLRTELTAKEKQAEGLLGLSAAEFKQLWNLKMDGIQQFKGNPSPFRAFLDL